MSATVVLLALSAAILHASWNAFLRSGADRLWSVTVMSISGTVIALPVLFLLPLPNASAWFYIVLSSVLQVAYSLFLVAAYRSADLGQIYPVVRGTVPLLVTLGGVAVTGDVPGPLQIGGTVLVAAGIMGLTRGRTKIAPASLIYALLTGAIIATYATVDSIGARESGQPIAYALWVVFLYGLLLLLLFVALRGRVAIAPGDPETWKALGGGIFAMIAYGAVVLAYTLGPAGPITALRETSVVFAVLLGWLFLGEGLTARRLAACAIVAAGAILIGR
ncbi:EamA family transporter [Ensifer soli]|uniref:EamA family transporter n=1 Tax=Ciceribacter sp. sgz301302 TaxID=3342379 RepID=UPI0035B9B939